MSEPATPALRWAQAAISLWLVAFMAILVDAGISKGFAPGQLAFGSAYAIAVLGLWRGVKWGFHLSIWMAWFATLMILMFLIPMPDDKPAAMTGLKAMIYRMDTDVWRCVMVALVVGAVTSTILLAGQKNRFRPGFW